MALFLDLDNTILPSKGAYDYALKQCAIDWKERKLGGSFLELYESARKQVKSQLKHHSSNRLRLLCFKLMFEMLRSNFKKNSSLNVASLEDLKLEANMENGFQTQDITEIFWMEERYFFHFLSFYTEEKNKDEYQTSLFPKLVSLSQEFPIYLTTNETLRTQLLKVQGFLPADFRFTLITSEEVGSEKPSKEFFQYVMAKTKEDPSDCILLGDNWEDDIIGASSHGISCIHVPEMWGKGDEVKECSNPLHSPTDKTASPHPVSIWKASNILSGLNFARSWLFQRQK